MKVPFEIADTVPSVLFCRRAFAFGACCWSINLGCAVAVILQSHFSLVRAPRKWFTLKCVPHFPVQSLATGLKGISLFLARPDPLASKQNRDVERVLWASEQAFVRLNQAEKGLVFFWCRVNTNLLCVVFGKQQENPTAGSIGSERSLQEGGWSGMPDHAMAPLEQALDVLEEDLRNQKKEKKDTTLNGIAEGGGKKRPLEICLRVWLQGG